MYIVVNDKVQSQGYGTKILKQIMKENKDKEIVLDIEPLDKDASNYEQREKDIISIRKMDLRKQAISSMMKTIQQTI